MSHMEAADYRLAPAAVETLDELQLTAEFSAVSRLIRQYAREIDRAQAIAARADDVLARIEDEQPDAVDLIDEVRALRAKLSARVAVSDLGPKLLAALESVGGTPKGRAALEKGAAGGPAPKTAAGGRLEALRRERHAAG